MNRALITILLVVVAVGGLNAAFVVNEWEQVIRRQAIVYVGLDALSDTTVASAVGNAMFADLASVAGRLYKHGRYAGLPEIGEAEEWPAISMHSTSWS